MKLLILVDIHGEYQKLDQLMDEVKEDYDLILCPGDFTDMFAPQDHFTQLDVANMVLHKLLTPGKPLLCVPGNQDPHEILETLNDHGVNLHGKKKSLKGLTLVGWGGALTPFNTQFEPTEEETKVSLERASAGLKDFILLLHNPPKDTKVDLTDGKHVGSPAIRNFILEHKPRLAITAHIHDAPGEDTLGETKLFNPGPVYEGNYGIVDISGKTITCTRRTIKKLS